MVPSVGLSGKFKCIDQWSEMAKIIGTGWSIEIRHQTLTHGSCTPTLQAPKFFILLWLFFQNEFRHCKNIRLVRSTKNIPLYPHGLPEYRWVQAVFHQIVPEGGKDFVMAVDIVFVLAPEIATIIFFEGLNIRRHPGDHAGISTV